MLTPCLIRPTTPADTEALARMIAGLAAHHGDVATISAERLCADGFGPRPCFESLIAEIDGTAVGYALWYRIYDARVGAQIVDLHHLYVVDSRRSAGIGRALIVRVVAHAAETGAARVAVGVLPTNERAVALYRELGFAERRAQQALRLVLPAEMFAEFAAPA